MVCHIVLWNITEKIKAGNEADLRKIKQTIKSGLEGLKDKVPGTISVRVEIDAQDSSNRDIALISEFENKDALAAYQKHPEHLKVVALIKESLENRACYDYEVK